VAPLLLRSWGEGQNVAGRRLYVMSLTRVCFFYSVWFVTLGQVCDGSEADNAQKWHSDIPTLAPDGVRVAYLQTDSPVTRIVVVNLDRTDQISYINIGEIGAEPIGIFWKTSRKIELRKGASTFAVVDADQKPELPIETSPQSGPTILPPLDQVAIRALLQRKLPHRSIHIMNWDEDGRRVLLLAAGTNDAGRFFVYDRRLDLLFEVARRKISVSTP
jgi:hypothetical protein